MKLHVIDAENEQKLRNEIAKAHKEYGDENALLEEIDAFFQKYQVPDDEAVDFVANKVFRFIMLSIIEEIEASLDNPDDKKEDT